MQNHLTRLNVIILNFYLSVLASLGVCAQTNNVEFPPIDFKNLGVFENKIFSSASSSFNVTAAVFTPEERAEAALLLKRAIQMNHRPEDQSLTGLQAKLIQLGDKETLQKFEERYHNGDREAIEVLHYSGMEIALPIFLEGVKKGSSSRERAGDVLKHSVVDTGLINAYRIIMESTLLPPETVAWGKKGADSITFSSVEPNVTLTKELLQWWDHNQAALVEQRLSDVTWVPKERPALTALSPEPDPVPSLRPPLPAEDHTTAYLWSLLGVLLVAMAAVLIRKLIPRKTKPLGL